MATPDLLRRLLATAGPSGMEGPPAAIWRDAASAFAEVTTDTMGNTVARVRGAGGGPLLGIFGHIDEIGLIVSHVDDKGFLYFTSIGGYRAATLMSQRVEVLTRDGVIPGVIATKPVQGKADRDRALELEDLHIDIGARDSDDARARVRNGDAAVLVAPPVDFPNDRLVSRALDNRIGAYVALEAARRAAETGAPGDVAAVASVQEEVGLYGARTSAFALDPEVAIVVDVTFATDRPGGDPKKLGEHALGSGPVLTRGPMISPLVYDLLERAAEEEGIPFTIEIAARLSNTDADVVHLSRGGVPTGVVSVPLRYMHSPIEMIQLDDVENAIRLIAAFARRLEPGLSFMR